MSVYDSPTQHATARNGQHQPHQLMPGNESVEQHFHRRNLHHDDEKKERIN